MKTITLALVLLAGCATAEELLVDVGLQGPPPVFDPGPSTPIDAPVIYRDTWGAWDGQCFIAPVNGDFRFSSSLRIWYGEEPETWAAVVLVRYDQSGAIHYEGESSVILHDSSPHYAGTLSLSKIIPLEAGEKGCFHFWTTARTAVSHPHHVSWFQVSR